LKLQLAAESDPVGDPTAVWPEDRETVIAGTLKVTGVMALDDASTPLVFDPTRLTDGIEPSNDPVLRFRPRVYSLSAERRSGSA
jgi:catalase